MRTTFERVTLRLANEDRANLATLATTLQAQQAGSAMPWQNHATISRCVRLALKLAAEAAARGELL